MNRLFSLLTTSALCSFLISCGGSGNNTNFVPTRPNTGSTAPTWVAGQFLDDAIYKDMCAVPRVGPDSNGDNFSDKQGTSMHEKMWLRSWTNDTYLWYDEVADNNPNGFSVADYFSQLRTEQRTASGSFKDNFHFAQSTEEYNQRTQGGVTSGYGISWEFVSATAPRKLVVRYTEPNSPASMAGVSRGLYLKSVDGIDFINANTSQQINEINAAIFPTDPGQTFNFVFSGDDQEQIILDVDLTSANIEIQPVQNVRVIDTAAGKVGYLQFNSFIRAGQPGLIDGFQEFKDQGITELVLDFRYNGGGLLAMASQIGFMVAGRSQTNNKTFETLQFNDKYPNQDPINGNQISPTPFYDREIDWTTSRFVGDGLPSVNLTRVYILATDNTCSASEAVINGLRGIDVEVVLIGGKTCGKPYGFYPTDNCSTTYFSIQFKGVNAKGFGEYSEGFIPVASPLFDDQLPGCNVTDDFTKALGNPNEALLAAAINYAETGLCPPEDKANSQAQPPPNNQGLAIKQRATRLDLMLNHNKIYTTIGEPSL
jgi:C-terminal processing protease CtpA/Prc